MDYSRPSKYYGAKLAGANELNETTAQATLVILQHLGIKVEPKMAKLLGKLLIPICIIIGLETTMISQLVPKPEVIKVIAAHALTAAVRENTTLLFDLVKPLLLGYLGLANIMQDEGIETPHLRLVA